MLDGLASRWRIGAWMLFGLSGLSACSRHSGLAGPGVEQVVMAPDAEVEFRAFVQGLVTDLAPLERDLNEGFLRAVVGGEAGGWDELPELELKLRQVFSRAAVLERLERWRADGQFRDPLLRRQVQLLILAHKENQLSDELLDGLVRARWRVEQAYHGYRFRLGGKEVREEYLYDLLRFEQEEKLRRKVFDVLMARARVVSGPLISLVKMRNRVARELGFANYYEMQLAFSELSVEKLDIWLEDLQLGSAKAWWEAKRLIDRQQRERLGLQAATLRAWHYEDPFLQRAPGLGDENPDRLLRARDWKQIVMSFFRFLGLDLGSVRLAVRQEEIGCSGYQAFCLAMDRDGDVRLFVEKGQGEAWLQTFLHEFGHAAYLAGIDPNLPWLLRQVAHPVLSEAVAILFSRLSLRADWLISWAQISPERVAAAEAGLKDLQRRSGLAFMRWALLVVRFERELYRNPDQDLNALWMRLRLAIQGIAEPPVRDEPDWAAVLHLASMPVSFQNYLLGEVLASQLEERLQTQVADPARSWFLQAAGGRWLFRNVFLPGRTHHWLELLRQTLGAEVEPRVWLRAFASDSNR